MSEQLDLTAPIVTPNRTTYAVTLLILDWTAQVIQVRLNGSDGVELRAQYEGAAAVALMTVLNTSNLSTSSLHKRVLQKLVADGKVPGGTVSGVAA